MIDNPIPIELLSATLTLQPIATYDGRAYHFQAAYENSNSKPVPITLKFCPEREECLDDLVQLCCPPDMPAEMQHEVYHRAQQVHSVMAACIAGNYRAE